MGNEMKSGKTVGRLKGKTRRKVALLLSDAHAFRVEIANLSIRAVDSEKMAWDLIAETLDLPTGRIHSLRHKTGEVEDVGPQPPGTQYRGSGR